MRIRMPSQPQKNINMVGLMFIFFVVGCSRAQTPFILPQESVVGIPTSDMSASIILPTQTASPTSALPLNPTLTPRPRPTITITPTLGPTLTFDERNARLIELLETNGGCELPCIWGIMPGETEWQEAFQLLFPLGQSGFEIPRGRNLIYSFEYQNHQEEFTLPVGMYVVNGIVDMAHEQLVVYENSPLLDQFWEHFSLRSLLIENGIPSRVGVILTTTEYYWPNNTYFTMWLFYDEEDILIIYYDIATRVDTVYRICPNQLHIERLAPLQFSFWTQSPGNERHLEDAYFTYTGGIPDYLLLQDAVGVGTNEFYDLIISGESEACFETPRDIWP
jgi:hypothetical protein